MQTKEKHIVLYGNGSAGNHGCEAIVRGTVQVLGGDQQYTVLSEDPRDDAAYGLDHLVELLPAKSKRRKNLAFWKAYAKLKLTGNFVDMDGLYYLPAIRNQKGKVDVALSVGGDNYCYGGTGIYAYLNRTFHNQGIKTVLWGCSIEPEVVKQPEVARDLNEYDLIVTRESITYEAVKAVQPNTILSPDPAFFMEAVVCDLDPRLESGNVIGINISPMIVSNETVSGMAYENYRHLISHILDTTDAYVALIPHVVWKTNDDRKVLEQLYEAFDRNERLILVEDHCAHEVKYIISKCSFFVGARTHATIAAYSSCVPTLVVGYSVKARGIARDLFGTEEGYVLPVQELATGFQLRDSFCKLYENREPIRETLAEFMCTISQKKQTAACALEELTKD